MKTIFKIVPYLITVVLAIFLMHKCSEEPEIITETVVKYKTVHDTIKQVEIQTEYIPKYVTKVKTVKGKDSIVYVKDTTGIAVIKANEYKAEVKSNNATADLNILTTGELLDVSGVITYKEKETTTTITKTKHKSGLFIYSESAVNPVFERAAIGLDYQIKNKFIIGANVSYNNTVKQVYANVKVGFKIL